MPIQNKDLGKYTQRPDIYIDEKDDSVITLPLQNKLINLVPGFSKKGPVNSPTYFESKSDFIKVFGDIDYGLERRGSFFHRTCLKMLESSPIWALNLLDTDDTRDFLNWKSLSLASFYKNNPTKEIPYSRVFNRQDFWKRDEESFLDYVNTPQEDTERLLHITNMGNKTITTFMYKSKITGFDVTLEDWYGGVTKIPAYLNPKDWVSDYIISVIILEGDWTNYTVLEADTVWGKYFDGTGLKKETIDDFLNEKNVNVLNYYEGSIIPYFKDIDDRNMYIVSLINNDTDKTGLFCTMNEDLLLDSEYPTGKLDLLGDGLVGVETSELDFLSYKENIVESLTYEQTPLDNANNVFGNYSTVLSDSFSGYSSRSASYTNWYVENVSIDSTVGTTLVQIEEIQQSSGKSWVTMDSSIDFWSGAVDNPANPHDGLLVGDRVYFNISYNGIEKNKAYYVEDVTDNSRWVTISETPGGSPITITNGTPTNLYIQKGNISANINTTSFFNIDGVRYTFDTGDTKSILEPLEFETLHTGYERYDLFYLTKGDDAKIQILKGEQNNASNAQKPQFLLDYKDNIILGYVHIYLTSGATPGTVATDIEMHIDYDGVTIDNTGYIILNDIIASGVTVGTSNYVRLSFGNTSGTTDLTDYNKLRYRASYNEMESFLDDGKGVIINPNTGEKYYIELATFVDYSSTSNAYIQIPVGTNDPTQYYGTNTEWLIYYLDNEFFISALATDRMLTTTLPIDVLGTSGQSNAAGVIGLYSNIYLDYYNGIINNGDFGYIDNVTGSTSTKIYLRMWTSNNLLYVDFVSDSTSSASPQPIENWDNSSNFDSKFIVWSNSSNYKQSVEIESYEVSSYPDKIYEIKVDKNRYSELIRGSFLEAYYDENEVAEHKKLTRIIKTTIDPINTDWKVLRTDLPIKISNNASVGQSADYQTMTYPQIDDYVSTYKGVSLIPFTIHQDSIPNGTEERQNNILNLIDKSTNLAKGLANKNKITWRYLIDSFGLGLTERSKQQYADLCLLKLNCFAFVNAPSAKQFKNSTNPYFINDDRTLNTEYLKAGGDETRNPSFLFSLATGNGRSTVGYFFPYVKGDADGIPKLVPPSADIATTYMQKHISTQSTIEPWTISAGVTNGRVINIAGTEMDFTDDDLNNLNSIGLNPIVKKRNAGYVIDNEHTAQIFPYSSLSLIHAREVLIELENALYDMLLAYQWRFNTAEVRAEIKYRADKICKDFQNRDALYAFKNTINETNNTDYIIGLSLGILETSITVVNGMGSIVNSITILKKGSLKSTGFSAQ